MIFLPKIEEINKDKINAEAALNVIN